MKTRIAAALLLFTAFSHFAGAQPARDGSSRDEVLRFRKRAL